MSAQAHGGDMGTDEIRRLSRTLENALQYVRGTGQWFSARNETAVISQLIGAQKTLDSLLAENERLARVVEAAKGYIASPEAGHTYHVPTQNAFAALVNALEACEKGAE